MSKASRPVEPVLTWRPSLDKATPTSARGRATSDEIRAATVRVLERMDFNEATMFDIAREAGIASGTVYRYFVDKHDVLLSLLAQVEVDLIRHTQNEVPSGPDGAISVRDGLLAYLAIYRQYAPLFGAWVNIMRPNTDLARSWNQSRHLFIDRLAGFLRRGQREGVVAATVDAEIVAELLMAASERSNYVRVVLGWTDVTDNEVADGMSVLFNDGVGSAATDNGSPSGRGPRSR